MERRSEKEMNTQELAIRIYSEIHYAIEGYYLADAGGEDIKEKIEQAIKDYISTKTYRQEG